jgi:patatin-like phospholipase/acyl hydrolase
MTGGTSTGSILAAGLAYPDVKNTEMVNQNINKNYKPDEIFIKPGFFAKELINIYNGQAT